MKIKTFKVERWMNDYEEQCEYNLAETCIDSLTIRELLELCGEDPVAYMADLSDTRLTYSHIFGSPELLKGIGSLYENVQPEDIIPTHGAIGANNQVITTLVEPKDNILSVMPTYQQHYSIPESIGAEVRIITLDLENQFLPDLGQIRSLVDENTKMITINNPNNPSGSLIPVDVMKEIVEIAKSVDAYVLCDEVYRGISEDDSYMPSIVDIYDKGISVGSMSKIYSMAGVRLGWIVSKDGDVIHRCHERRDYDTISVGVIDDKLAALCLMNKEKVLERNRKILLGNRKILDDWVNNTPEVYYQKPVAGTTALVYYKKDMPSHELCVKLLEEKGVLFTPGECFEMEGSVRIGYAFDSQLLQTGLDKFAEFFEGNLMGKKLEDMSLEELWQLFPIKLSRHQDVWRDWYREEERRIVDIFPEITVSVNHIGSTAIEGISAKPIVDILVEFPLDYDLDTAREKLVEKGYICMSDKGRISLNKGYSEEGFAEKVFHVHLRHAGDNDELYFRDYMNENPDLAKAYEELKISLWKKYEHERDAYTEGKTKFVTEKTAEAKEKNKNRLL